MVKRCYNSSLGDRSIVRQVDESIKDVDLLTVCCFGSAPFVGRFFKLRTQQINALGLSFGAPSVRKYWKMSHL